MYTTDTTRASNKVMAYSFSLLVGSGSIGVGMENLPMGVIGEIGKHLDSDKDKANFSQTNKRHHRVIQPQLDKIKKESAPELYQKWLTSGNNNNSRAIKYLIASAEGGYEEAILEKEKFAKALYEQAKEIDSFSDNRYLPDPVALAKKSAILGYADAIDLLKTLEERENQKTFRNAKFALKELQDQGVLKKLAGKSTFDKMILGTGNNTHLQAVYDGMDHLQARYGGNNLNENMDRIKARYNENNYDDHLNLNPNNYLIPDPNNNNNQEDDSSFDEE